MPTLSQEEIGLLLRPYLLEGNNLEALPLLLNQLSIYLDLLMKWNQRMNLTAIRDPKEIVRRHFGESLFLAQHLSNGGTVLDLGSGAGFPGIPLQLWHPDVRVTLAESQAKKAAFLREAVRSLSLLTEVWSGRAEELASIRSFGAVVLRAVDDPGRALSAAFSLSAGDVGLLGSGLAVGSLPEDFAVIAKIGVPERLDSWLFQLRHKSFHVEQSSET